MFGYAPKQDSTWQAKPPAGKIPDLQTRWVRLYWRRTSLAACLTSVPVTLDSAEHLTIFPDGRSIKCRSHASSNGDWPKTPSVAFDFSRSIL
ncbi:hypothetical protein HPB47_014256 [Ixodes persulcatus]|uniref:Uncharacterized protein n=1 Tax=Ixodes persulcatus TaxID=34615 RepID=A0AC60QWR2_IXOPE|nr:hypothetical protein HPB47_014256 [Ixodes persulcatus]